MRLVPDRPVTLLELVIEKLGLSTRVRGKQLVAHSAITINGRETNDPRTLVNPGDEVLLERLPVAPTRKKRPPFPVHYEDAHLLVAEKPAGILTHGVGEKRAPSFFAIMDAWLDDVTRGKERLFIVHRLDKEVTGLLIFAKSAELQTWFKTHWKSVEKRYCALVEGAPPAPEGTMESWLHEHPDTLKVSSGPQRPNAKLAVTHWRTLSPRGPYTLLELRLDTGRKNQIRVQLADLGCPIVGDYRYGADASVKRQIRLCAYQLSFPHPVTGMSMSFQLSPDPDFLNPSDVDEKYK